MGCVEGSQQVRPVLIQSKTASCSPPENPQNSQQPPDKPQFSQAQDNILKSPIPPQQPETAKQQQNTAPQPPNTVNTANTANMGAQKPLPPIQKIEFLKQSEKMLEGKSSTQKTGGKDVPNIVDLDCFGSVGVMSLWYQNFCYTDGQYNNNNFKIQKGLLSGKQAYKIHPPEKKFTKFLASKHCVIFKLSTVQNYTVYKFQNNSLDIAVKIQKSRVKADSYTLVPQLTISQLAQPIVLLVLPSNQTLTPFTSLGKDVQGATVYNDDQVRVQLIKFSLPCEPPTPQDFSHGPNSHYNCYNPNRNFFIFQVQGKEYLVWGDKDKKNAYLTQIDRKNTKIVSTPIKQKIAGYELSAACGNNEGVFYTQIQSGPASSGDGTRKMFLVKCDFNGAQKGKQLINTDKKSLNIYNFDACQMAINGQSIGLIVSRKMTKSSDGLNHQGAYAAVFNAKTLKVVKQQGQTSSHSFSHSLIAKQNGGFLGMDLADNYPRGIHHWDFDLNSMKTKLVYSFKTLHGQKAQSPAGASYPQYKQISTKDKKFYKWSNDNKTYTQLAAPGIFEHQTGNIIIFAGENEPRSLDNSKTGDYNNCSRNIGFVKVSKDLNAILSDGPQDTGGFFNFNGQWQQLKNKGIKWLTKFNQFNSASRVKSVGLKGKVIIVFQLWSKDAYINTQYMIVDSDGKVVVPNTVIPHKIRLQKSDDIYATENSVLLYSGGKGGILNRYEIFILK